ncbi:uncharacterized protein LOC132197544 [Neocloeon triangulifer]|uniref:uncharacterized protein LOC132197544 n=1 Tax=Neocloeon triangulifer TaxID=2078957 RepID=UPI00286FAA6B|nr:uncharacterized protein LOC132197544 [Neocloeon triangulifer]
MANQILDAVSYKQKYPRCVALSAAIMSRFNLTTPLLDLANELHQRPTLRSMLNFDELQDLMRQMKFDTDLAKARRIIDRLKQATPTFDIVTLDGRMELEWTNTKFAWFVQHYVRGIFMPKMVPNDQNDPNSLPSEIFGTCLIVFGPPVLDHEYKFFKSTKCLIGDRTQTFFKVKCSQLPGLLSPSEEILSKECSSLNCFLNAFLLLARREYTKACYQLLKNCKGGPLKDLLYELNVNRGTYSLEIESKWQESIVKYLMRILDHNWNTVAQWFMEIIRVETVFQRLAECRNENCDVKDVNLTLPPNLVSSDIDHLIGIRMFHERRCFQCNGTLIEKMLISPHLLVVDYSTRGVARCQEDFDTIRNSGSLPPTIDLAGIRFELFGVFVTKVRSMKTSNMFLEHCDSRWWQTCDRPTKPLNHRVPFVPQIDSFDYLVDFAMYVPDNP